MFKREELFIHGTNIFNVKKAYHMHETVQSFIISYTYRGLGLLVLCMPCYLTQLFATLCSIERNII